jgi:hypothetical protein
VYQRLIPTGEQAGLQTLIAATESVSLFEAEEKLKAFLELESVICACGSLQQLGQMTRVRSRSSRKLCACVTSRNSSGVR